MLPTAQTSSASGDLHEVTAGCDPDGDSLCFDGRFRKIGIQNLNTVVINFECRFEISKRR